MVELSKDNFENEVLKADRYVLVDYWGSNCNSCLKLMPHIEKLDKKYGDKLKFTILNTSKARRLAINQKVTGLPTIVIYKDGEKIESLVGDKVTEGSVTELVKKYA
ncbi:MAG TPA: thioredoxin domain-containing protein [Tissierellaceae bacterium]|nr:thioredoxin domain-containing protein [Tissierellaceae bacterium]